MTRTEIVRLAITEDAPWGDVTSRLLVAPDSHFEAEFVAREPGVMSGTAVLTEVFKQIDPSCSLSICIEDADRFVAGERIAYVSGPTRSILLAERIALNFLQRLCGVATSTAQFVDAVSGTDVRIVDTRKTTPGIRLLEKAAVVHGGGCNHRFSLSDAILVKDNHLVAIGGVGRLGDLKARAPHLMQVEIEIDRLDQIVDALSAGADSILCDNFSLDNLHAAVTMINGRALVNASGGVTLDSVKTVAETGVDLVSVGALTHSVNSVDIGLDAGHQVIYFDHAATSPLRREALEAMWPYLTTVFGNPSSTHEVGREARLGLEHARAELASVFGCRPAEITFTSGGTEADNLAVAGLALSLPRSRRIITTRIEHQALLETCNMLSDVHGFDIEFAEVDGNGFVDVDSIVELLRPDTTLCSVMYANNEIGTVQPVADIAVACREVGVPFHTDAVQAAGWMSLNVEELGVDSLSISAHKFGGPKGTGALYVRSGLIPKPIIYGGGQERGLRSGTENVASAVGMASALALAERERAIVVPHVTKMRDRIIDAVATEISGAQLTGARTQRLPNHVSFCVEHTFGESILVELEADEIICSSGSACAAGSDEVSHVLTAVGIDDDIARTALRFSLGPGTTDAEVDQLLERLPAAVDSVRSLA